VLDVVHGLEERDRDHALAQEERHRARSPEEPDRRSQGGRDRDAVKHPIAPGGVIAAAGGTRRLDLPRALKAADHRPRHEGGQDLSEAGGRRIVEGGDPPVMAADVLDRPMKVGDQGQQDSPEGSIEAARPVDQLVRDGDADDAPRDAHGQQGAHDLDG